MQTTPLGCLLSSMMDEQSVPSINCLYHANLSDDVNIHPSKYRLITQGHTQGGLDSRLVEWTGFLEFSHTFFLSLFIIFIQIQREVF